MTADVDAAWDALRDGLDTVNSRSFSMGLVVDDYRPRIEAAIRNVVLDEARAVAEVDTAAWDTAESVRVGILAAIDALRPER